MNAHTRAEYVGAGLLALLGAGLAFGGTDYGVLNEEGRVGPGFMPFVTGSLLVLFGVVIAFETRRAAGRAASTEATEGSGPSLLELALSRDDGEQGVPDGEVKDRNVAVVFGLTLAAILLTPVLGFLLAFGLLIFVLVTFVEREGPMLGLLVTVAAIGVTYLVFVLFLAVPLPTGYFGF